MPKARIDGTLDMHYELDNFTDPWTTPETILLVHGAADTSKAWFAWVPQLARSSECSDRICADSASRQPHHRITGGRSPDSPET